MNSRLASLLMTIVSCALAVALLSGCRGVCDLFNNCPDDSPPWPVNYVPHSVDFKGKFYFVVYSSGYQATEISDGKGKLVTDPKLFQDIAAAWAKSVSVASSAAGPRLTPAPKLTAAAADGPSRTTSVYFVSSAGAWLRRFDPQQQTIDGSIQLTCTDTLEFANELQLNADGSTGVVITRGTSTKQYCAVVFDPATFTVGKKIPLPLQYEFRKVELSSDGQTAYVNMDLNDRTSNTSSVFLVDLKNGTVGPSIDVKPAGRLMAMTPDGKRLFLVGVSVAVIDLATQTFSVSPLPNTNPCNAGDLAMHPNGSKLYLIGSNNLNNPLCIVDTATGTLANELFPFPNTNVLGIAPNRTAGPQFTVDGQFLAMMGQRNEIVIWDTVTDTAVRRLPLPDGLFSPQISFFFVPD